MIRDHYKHKRIRHCLTPSRAPEVLSNRAFVQVAGCRDRVGGMRIQRLIIRRGSGWRRILIRIIILVDRCTTHGTGTGNITSFDFASSPIASKSVTVTGCGCRCELDFSFQQRTIGIVTRYVDRWIHACMDTNTNRIAL